MEIGGGVEYPPYFNEDYINYKKGKVASVLRDGKPVWEITYDAAGAVRGVKDFYQNAVP